MWQLLVINKYLHLYFFISRFTVSSFTTTEKNYTAVFFFFSAAKNLHKQHTSNIKTQLIKASSESSLLLRSEAEEGSVFYLLCVCQGEWRVPSCWYPSAGRYRVSSDLLEAGMQEGVYQLNIEKAEIHESFPLFKVHIHTQHKEF